MANIVSEIATSEIIVKPYKKAHDTVENTERVNFRPVLKKTDHSIKNVV